MNKYFEIPEYVEKVSKSRLEKISQKIWFTRKFPKNWRNYEKNKPFGSVDGTWVRSGDNWKPI